MAIHPSQPPAITLPPDYTVGFSVPDAQRIQTVVRYVETVQRSRPRARARWPVGAGGGAASIVGIFPAKAGASGIAARATAGNGFEQVGSASVTLLQKDASGYLYVPVHSLSLGSGGLGYTDGTGYSLTFSGGDVMSGHAATGTFDVIAGAVANLKITGGGEYKPGGTAPTVSFTGAGSGTGASITATIGETVTCNNAMGSAVGDNHYLMIGLDSSGDYWVLAEDCS